MTLTEPIVFNPFDPAFRVNPYPVYKRLLEEDPVHVTLFGVRAFARYADQLAILKDRRWSSDERKSPLYAAQRESARQALGEDADTLDLERPFLFRDPPDHTRLRSLVNKAFTPRVVEELRPRIQEIVDELLDAVAAKGEMEVIEDLAYLLPVTVICEMLGVPVEDQEQFKGWSRILVRGLDPEISTPPEELRRRAQAIKAFNRYLRQLVTNRRQDPRDDLLTALIAAEEEGNKLTEDELLSTCSLILVAGHETTVNLIGNGVLQLIRHPEELAKLRADPTLARSAVEEVLRFDPPVQFNGRLAGEDIEIAGVTVTRGEFVILLIGAAGRDPAQFDDPDRFDITRNDDRHMGFGYGIHFCLGAPLARVEGEIALRTLTQRFQDLRLLQDPPPYKDMITLRGLAALPIAFRA